MNVYVFNFQAMMIKLGSNFLANYAEYSSCSHTDKLLKFQHDPIFKEPYLTNILFQEVEVVVVRTWYPVAAFPEIYCTLKHPLYASINFHVKLV